MIFQSFMFISFIHDLIANVHIDWYYLNTMITEKSISYFFVF